jgi:hypothetical protein
MLAPASFRTPKKSGGSHTSACPTKMKRPIISASWPRGMSSTKTVVFVG